MTLCGITTNLFTERKYHKAWLSLVFGDIYIYILSIYTYIIYIYIIYIQKQRILLIQNIVIWVIYIFTCHKTYSADIMLTKSQILDKHNLSLWYVRIMAPLIPHNRPQHIWILEWYITSWCASNMWQHELVVFFFRLHGAFGIAWQIDYSHVINKTLPHSPFMAWWH